MLSISPGKKMENHQLWSSIVKSKIFPKIAETKKRTKEGELLIMPETKKPTLLFKH